MGEETNWFPNISTRRPCERGRSFLSSNVIDKLVNVVMHAIHGCMGELLLKSPRHKRDDPSFILSCLLFKYLNLYISLPVESDVTQVRYCYAFYFHN